MSEAALPSAHRSGRRPLGATVWFVWMVSMWVEFFVLLYAVLAAASLATAVAMIVVWDAAWWPTVVFALVPDLAVLFGIAPGLARGQLHPRAVPLYNAFHRFWGPLAVAVAVLAAGLPLGYLAGTLAWAGHVAFDRAIGLRLRTPDGFQRGDAHPTRVTHEARDKGGFDAIDQGRSI